MLSSERNLEAILRMLQHTRRYGELRLEAFERSTVDKLSTLVTAMILGAIACIVGALLLVALSAAAIVALAPSVGGYLPAILIVAAVYAVGLWVLWMCRAALIMGPVKRALARLFLNDKAERPGPTADDISKAARAIGDDYAILTEPPSPARNKMEWAMNTATRAWSVADGVLFGYRIINRFFGRKRRR